MHNIVRIVVIFCAMLMASCSKESGVGPVDLQAVPVHISEFSSITEMARHLGVYETLRWFRSVRVTPEDYRQLFREMIQNEEGEFFSISQLSYRELDELSMILMAWEGRFEEPFTREDYKLRATAFRIAYDVHSNDSGKLALLKRASSISGMSESDDVEDDEPAKIVYVLTLDEKGRITFEGQPLELDELAMLFENLNQNGGRVALRIVIEDPGVLMGDVVRVVNSAFQAGLLEISFAPQ